MPEYHFTSRSAEETQTLAAKLAQDLKPGDVLALVGDLASGKTTFVQGLAAHYKIEEYASSPTFTYINEYHGGSQDLIHIDAYRLKSGEELVSMGLWDYLESDASMVIEWADIVQSVLPPDSIHMSFLADDEISTQRHITIHSSRPLDLSL